jgi:transposase-like protein
VPAPRKYPNELRERAKRLVQEAREQDPTMSMNQAVLRIGPRVGVNPDTLRDWVKQGDIDAGRRPGTTTSEAATIKELELGTLSWVHWFNETRLHSSIGHVPPVEFEAEYYRHNPQQQPLLGEPSLH